MYRLLHIDADPDTRRAVLRSLAESPLPFEVRQVAEQVDRRPDGLGDTAFDALLLGAGPGVGTGAEALASLARWRQRHPVLPIILLTGTADLAFAREAFRAGAQDVVTSHERALAVLPRILLYAIERAGTEARGKRAETRAATLALLLDAILASSTEAILQTDAEGTIERASPAAAGLLGFPLPPPPGAHLGERVAPRERLRLQAFITASAGATTTAVFGSKPASDSRLIELRPIALAGEPAGLRLFRVSELVPAFAPAAEPAPVPAGSGTRSGGLAARPDEPAGTGPPPDPVVPVASPLLMLRSVAELARWHATTAAGGAEGFAFLGCDRDSAQMLHRLSAVAREDFDFALAFDTLRVKGWQDVVARMPDSLPPRLVLEVSYGTVASRPHFERLLAALAASPPGLAQRFVLTLQDVPKGIYVPTLGKAIRAMGSSYGKPALQLPELDTDYRNLALGHLALMILAVDDLKRALARDAREVTAFLARARGEGCHTIVRGVTGALAEALRSRLGIDMTVAA